MNRSTQALQAMAIKNIVAETMGFQCKLDAFIAVSHKRDSIHALRLMLQAWATFLHHMIPNMAEEAREPFEALEKELLYAISQGKSRSRSVTKKLKQDGGTKKGIGREPPPSQSMLVLRKATKATKSTVLALAKLTDELRFDKYTKERVKYLTTLEKRYIVAGKHVEAAKIYATISAMREEAILFPTIPPSLVAGIMLYCIYMTPTWIKSTVITAMSLGLGAPAAITSGVVGAGAQYVWNVVSNSNTTTAGERATQAAMLAGQAVSNSSEVIIDATTQHGHARQLGYVVGAMVFIKFILITLLKYNTLISEARTKARKAHIEMLQGFEAPPANLPALENETKVGELVKEIYTHFGITKEDEAKAPKEVFQAIKRAYHRRLLADHPNKGGKAEDLQKTRDLFKQAQHILLEQGVNIDVDDANNAFSTGGGRRRRTQRRSRSRSRA